MSDEDYYLQATEELRRGFIDEALWAKAYVKADGDTERQTVEYLKLRVAKLRRIVLRDQTGQTAELVSDLAQAWWKPVVRLILLLTEWGIYICSTLVLCLSAYFLLFEQETFRWRDDHSGLLAAAVLLPIFAFALLRRLRRRL